MELVDLVFREGRTLRSAKCLVETALLLRRIAEEAREQEQCIVAEEIQHPLIATSFAFESIPHSAEAPVPAHAKAVEARVG